jgi:hypothetical protein
MGTFGTARTRSLTMALLLSAGCGGAPAGGGAEDDGGASSTSDPGSSSGAPGGESSSGGAAGDESSSGGASASGSTGEFGDTTGDDGGSSTGEGGGESSTGDDGREDELRPPETCPLADLHVPCDGASDDPLHAIGLNCTSLGSDWTDQVDAVAADKIEVKAAPEKNGKRPWQVARAYGSHVDPETQRPFWGPREGEKVLLMSSGLLPPPDEDGAVLLVDGDVYSDVSWDEAWDSDTMPPPMNPSKGSPDPLGFTGCDMVGDCSNTLETQWNLGLGEVDDKMWIRFELTAPSKAKGAAADVRGYSFEFAYFSAEFPEYVDTEYNDIFVVWQASEDYTGNVTFIDDQPLTVTGLWPIDYVGECPDADPNCVGADEHLAGTGHRLDGGATGWYRATSGVNPGETFTLSFGIFDMGDALYDTTAIVDNWRWDCEGCVPNEVESCGLEPM